MDRDNDGYDRREFLKRTLVAGIAAGMGHALLAGQVRAMGEKGQLVEGLRKVKGSVLINGRPSAVGAVIAPGDIVTTGGASLAVFVVGKDAYLVRENSRIELVGERGGAPGAGIVTTLKVAAGKVLSVFGSGGKRVETVTAVAGIRGTGMYVELFNDVTYICLCYGTMELEAKAYPGERETITTKHHEEPHYILPAGMKQPYLEAPMLNHTDEELIMLESLVGRVPPFGDKPVMSGRSGY